MLSPLRSGNRSARRFRRGIYLLPSMFTVANMFCGYACVVYRGEKDRTRNAQRRAPTGSVGLA